MVKFLLRLIIYAMAVLLTAYLLPGVNVDDIVGALIVAALLTLLNATLKPILVFLTIPLTVITLGLFLLVINTVIILLAAYLIDSFHVDGFLWAFLFSLVLSLVNSIFLAIAGVNE